MFYSDYGFRVYAPRLSNYIIRFARHFDQYTNSRLIRSVDYAQIVWC